MKKDTENFSIQYLLLFHSLSGRYSTTHTASSTLFFSSPKLFLFCCFLFAELLLLLFLITRLPLVGFYRFSALSWFPFFSNFSNHLAHFFPLIPVWCFLLFFSASNTYVAGRRCYGAGKFSDVLMHIPLFTAESVLCVWFFLLVFSPLMFALRDGLYVNHKTFR